MVHGGVLPKENPSEDKYLLHWDAALDAQAKLADSLQSELKAERERALPLIDFAQKFAECVCCYQIRECLDSCEFIDSADNETMELARAALKNYE